jgi:hypothetical protein
MIGNLFWELHQQGRIREGIADARSARQSAQDARLQVKLLQAQCDKLSIICEALWTLLREKLDLNDEELIQRVTEIDLSDGVLDGKVRRTPKQCVSCDRTLSPRFPKCIYCGADTSTDPFGR